jgi:hypothetical protein
VRFSCAGEALFFLQNFEIQKKKYALVLEKVHGVSQQLLM